ncbi:MAG: bifunctional aldolase/short-chain dehydrogenase [Nitrospinaceae bacterium]|jgi:rhamnose utilization protein RhaD (predicted bifunctional aldolase and dehydrogenase)/NAD(P)-dependent dehydrogenase (short-subunit alcohol dehydrogenase family)|nr:bifunctional aldolase/short-chain dehydrogenase [Nitrospinaceae bacterium]MDP7057079.1 bifunctional aldolase/short-chain dehydrogenase [Nitrospinaceae bacterium]|tara:strand:+ start:2592 stop:4649 length:2058 start_codon:yes stop_codon:yes gene_type:complete
MKNLWNDSDAKAAIQLYNDVSEDIALRVYTSRLIGADLSLVLHGGGNTSVKSVTKNALGEEVNVLYVKGSGWDLDTLQPPGLPGVQLDHLIKLRQLDSLSDEDMVNEQRTHLLDASSPNPSVETLLHAFLPHKFIDHSHADAILVIADQPDSEALCKKIYGDAMGIVPYIMPGFDLAKAAAEVYEKNPDVKGLFLVNHGLFTFGDTAKESYDRHIEAVQQAEDFIASHDTKTLSPVATGTPASEDEMLSAIAPCLRGLYTEETGQSWVIHYREDPIARDFASSKECADWSQIGTATPDHVIRTKQKPLLLNPKHIGDPEELREEIASALEEFKRSYHRYFETNVHAKGVDKNELDPLPRIILVAGLGLVAIGKSVKETKIAADIYQHTMDIISKAFNVGQFTPLKDFDLFDMEYWSLEQAKLGKSKPALTQGKIVYITGAASGIGRATAELFAKNGASLFLVDRDEKTLSDTVEELRTQFKTGIVSQVMDVTDEKAVKESFAYVTREFGGLDILISNAGNAVRGRIGDVESAMLRQSFELNFFAHQTLASEAVKLFQKQKTGGVLLFNASKAAFNPGKDFGPYALPKATVIALMKQYALDYGAEGIRSNAINADRIRTRLFTEKVVAERSAARGLTPDEYFKSNLLATEVYDTDVAKGFFESALAEKTTGSVITIDGGNIAASPR